MAGLTLLDEAVWSNNTVALGCTKKDGFGALNANSIVRFSPARINGEAVYCVERSLLG